MAEMGIDVWLSARGRDLVRRRIRSMAEDLVRLWTDEAGEAYAGDATTAELSMHIDRIRAVAWQSAAHVTAQEIGRAVARADQLSPRNHTGQAEPPD